jgi:hypothetical protein
LQNPPDVTVPAGQTLAHTLRLNGFQQRIVLRTWSSIYAGGSANIGSAIVNSLSSNSGARYLFDQVSVE